MCFVIIIPAVSSRVLTVRLKGRGAVEGEKSLMVSVIDSLSSFVVYTIGMYPTNMSPVRARENDHSMLNILNRYTYCIQIHPGH